MMAYLIKVIGCSGLLLLVYLLFLQREKMYRFNRFYLLFSIVFSFFVPLIPVTISTPLPLVTGTAADVVDNITAILPEQVTAIDDQVTTIDERVNYWPIALITLYIAVTTFLLCRFIINLFTLYRKIRTGRQVNYAHAAMVLTEEAVTPFSFLHYIFINKQDFNDGIIEKEILRHELTHVRQKHSLDILLLESLLVFCWVNPFLFLYRKAIQLNHEFLADESVINTFHDTASYQYLLFNKLSGKSNALLTSSFNYLITKKRLTMMNKQTNRTVALVKQVALLPVLAGMVFLFSTKVYAQQPTQVKPPSETENKVPPTVTRAPKQKIPYGPGATQEQLTEYDKVVKSITTEKEGKNGKPLTYVDMRNVNINQMSTIYKLMNEEQRSVRNQVTGAGFIAITTPPARKHSTDSQLQARDTSKPKPPTVKRIVMRHIPLGPGATEEQLAEYDNVISRIVSTGVTKDGKTITRIDSKGVDHKKIGGIYRLMNEAQRATRDPAVGEMMVPLGPPAKKHPTATQLQAWMDAAKYGIWIDDKRVDNSELQKHQSSDFDLYFESKLTKNAINYGKHYYQVDLYTVDYYKKKLSGVSVTEMTHTSN
jgi:beta-lactamase regulating signal transducer with metallopeptidase domain